VIIHWADKLERAVIALILSLKSRTGAEGAESNRPASPLTTSEIKKIFFAKNPSVPASSLHLTKVQEIRRRILV
jgi:hypothetical protein